MYNTFLFGQVGPYIIFLVSHVINEVVLAVVATAEVVGFTLLYGKM